MKIKEVVQIYSKRLTNITHIPNKEVEILILHILDKNIIWLHLNYDKEFNEINALEKLISKRENNYPLEYLINKVSFYGETFFIKENVLIPRPETELLIDEILKIHENDKFLNVLEIGVGSGIISIMLAKLLPDIKVIGVDINDDAIKLANENAIKHGVSEQVTFIKSDLFENVNAEFDLCVSNPPYIANNYKLPKNVDFEPKSALFGGEIGDELLKKIIDGSIDRKFKYLCCEMGYDQKKPLMNYMSSLNQNKYHFYKDYSDFDRGFVLKIN